MRIGRAKLNLVYKIERGIWQIWMGFKTHSFLARDFSVMDL